MKLSCTIFGHSFYLQRSCQVYVSLYLTWRTISEEGVPNLFLKVGAVLSTDFFKMGVVLKMGAVRDPIFRKQPPFQIL